MDDKRIIARRHFDIAANFFHLVELILSETINRGNMQNYIEPPIHQVQQTYKQMTRWGDFRIIIPVLFNFFHGIELNLKGTNYLTDIPQSKKINHKLSDLLEKFKENHTEQIVLIDIYNYYISPNSSCSILKNLYAYNNIPDSSDFYEIFRYPYTKNMNEAFDYKFIRNNGEKGIEFFKKIRTDITKIQKKTEMIALSFRFDT
ncbi:MAG: hypothetical protein WC384_00865 [Prolixibacteraceae bacterium]|jgi:hypothetical protein